MNTNFENLRQVFLEVMDHPPSQWEALLDERCGHDPDLRRQVALLLQAHAAGTGILDRGAVTGAPAETGELAKEGPGTVLGPYQLVERLGEGGFGVVFLAEQQQPVRRQVALKVVKPGMDTRQVVARFEAERQALALMDHPNIARVFDGGETAAGRPYFVMELVRGTPFTDYCDRERLNVRRRLELFVQVCQAVQHAHQKGVIHRDLKPSNVLVAAQDGRAVPKVIDFGVAKAARPQGTETTAWTHGDQVIGTPLYMSPEQAQGGLDIDTRADIYALGVLLYELLTGTTPFDRERLRAAGYDEMRRIIREEEPARPSARITALGPAVGKVAAGCRSDPRRLIRLCRGELDWVVMKCLEKERDRRYESANALALDVQRYLDDEPVQACPPGAGYRLRKFARRHKGKVLAASVVLLALVIGIIGTTWGLVRATDAERDAVDAASKTVQALQRAEQKEQEAKDQLFLSLLHQAEARQASRKMGQRLDALDALGRAARLRRDDRLRDAAIAAMALPDLRPGPTWDAGVPGWGKCAFDGQYLRYARIEAAGGVSVRSIPDDRELVRVQAGERPRRLDLSPDGRFLVVLGQGWDVRVWRVADGQPAIPTVPSPCFAVTFTPDGRHLAVGWSDRLRRFELESGRELPSWPLAAKAHALAFSPNGRRLAVGFYHPRAAVSIHDTLDPARVWELQVGLSSGQVVAWHPDGERLAVGSSEHRIQVWDVPAQRRLATLEGHVQHVTDVTFHPGGELLASASWDGVLRVWHAGTGVPLMQTPLTASPRFSTDGRWLGVAWQGKQAQLLEVAPCPEYVTLVSRLGAGQGEYALGDISRDSRLLALGMDDGVRLWDLDARREVAFLPGAGTTTAHFRPKGGLLTGGWDGLWEWPFSRDEAAPGRLRVGPPVPIRTNQDLLRTALSRDGKAVALMRREGSVEILRAFNPNATPALTVPNPDGTFIALSPDGSRLATGAWTSERVRLLDAKTGAVLREWGVARAEAFFTPDGSTLVICPGDSFDFWDVKSGRLVRQLPWDIALSPGCVAFAPDDLLMAVEMAPAVIHLKEVATGKTVARLVDPNGDRASWIGFTPDGTRLVTAARYARAVHVWDLQAIRARLKEMSLDWEWPEFRPRAAPPPAPLTVEVVSERPAVAVARDRGRALAANKDWDDAVAAFAEAIRLEPTDPELWRGRADCLLALRRWRDAVADLNRALTLGPPADPAIWYTHAAVLLRVGDVAGYRKLCERMHGLFGAGTKFDDVFILAHTCVLGPGALGDPVEVVRLAELRLKTTTAAVHQSWSRHVVGNAYFRAGQHQKAINFLEPAIDADPRWDHQIWNWLVIAMAHHELGRLDQAREWFDKADRWLKQAVKNRPNWSGRTWAALEAIHGEAAALIGGPKPEKQEPSGKRAPSQGKQQ
jgi:serine/threonine protein kinase/WD40 repeat protein/Flp pilus assembly protein TadD